MLIRNAEVWGHGLADVRLADGRIAAIGDLPMHYGEVAIDAQGAALLPGLHDHHIHLAAMAVRSSSAQCGPPDVQNAQELAEALNHPGSGWLRGVGYHESVMGLPTARQLDEILSHRPLRIQHRGGRMWLLNSLALEELLSQSVPPPGLQRDSGSFTGHLFEEDDWLQQALASTPPAFDAVSAELARFGLTGLTDMSPRNDPAMSAHFAEQRRSGSLLQHTLLAGTLALADAPQGLWQIGPAKLHLHEAAMPDFDATIRFIQSAHQQQRGVAVHCTTEVEMVFALAVFEAAGIMQGDRIEHASITMPDQIAQIAKAGIAICVQPHFIAERGDRYKIDVEARHQPDLYRLASLQVAGITLAGGSDAPFGSADPWASMAAAVSRKTQSGADFGADETLSPESALALYLACPTDLTQQRQVKQGASADLCLLKHPWAQARDNICAALVRATFIGGNCIYQAPA